MKSHSASGGVQGRRQRALDRLIRFDKSVFGGLKKPNKLDKQQHKRRQQEIQTLQHRLGHVRRSPNDK